MYIRGSRFSKIENETQAVKTLTAVLCVQISYLSDSIVTVQSTLHYFSYLIHHLQEIYYQKSHENINSPATKGHHLHIISIGNSILICGF